MAQSMKQKPALLDNTQPKKYNIFLTVGNDIVEMTFTDKTMAQDEYNRIKSAGIYAGRWIKHIQFDEIVMSA
jgi:hypothetical protein